VAVRQPILAGNVPRFQVLTLFCSERVPMLVRQDSQLRTARRCHACHMRHICHACQARQVPTAFIRPRLTPRRRAAAGMVGETGEATARFLRSVAAGEVDARDAIARAAAVGLKRLQTPPSPLPAQPQHVSQQLARPRSLRVPPATCSGSVHVP
jgi:hypothetical protein